MTHSFVGESADSAWKEALSSLKADGVLQPSRSSNTHELLHANIVITNPRNRWVFSRHPGINPAFAIVEVFWILSGRNDAKLVNFWNPTLPKFAGDTPEYHGAYGYRLRNAFNGLDQINRAYTALMENPESRQIVLQIWNPNLDMPDEHGSPMSPDIPCNICAMPKIRNGKLEWLQIMRSNDIFRGLPYNLVQFTTLQEIFAGWLGLEVGHYHQVSDSLHYYEKDLSSFSIDNNMSFEENEDSLALPKPEFDKLLIIMMKSLEVLSSQDLSKDTFMRIFLDADLPQSYQNLLLITAADSARRRGWFNETDLAVKACTNKALLLAWNNWQSTHL
ncbi:MAG: thymidylate synthase [Mariprofundus sp.]|nr:thymidylate synthase [Mariprofundus sp.]